jgi:hypothetical protein
MSTLLLEHAVFFLGFSLTLYFAYWAYKGLTGLAFRALSKLGFIDPPPAPLRPPHPGIYTMRDLLAEANRNLARARCENIDLREALESERRRSAKNDERLRALREAHEWAGDEPVPVLAMATYDWSGFYVVSDQPLFGPDVDRALDALVEKDKYLEF